MNTRLASISAAVALTFGALLSPVMAQSYNAPAGIPAIVAPGGLDGQGGAYNLRAAERGRYDDLTTGSIGRRGLDRSAKDGNAEQPSRIVPNYGTTSGGPAY